MFNTSSKKNLTSIIDNKLSKFSGIDLFVHAAIRGSFLFIKFPIKYLFLKKNRINKPIYKLSVFLVKTLNKKTQSNLKSKQVSNFGYTAYSIINSALITKFRIEKKYIHSKIMTKYHKPYRARLVWNDALDFTLRGMRNKRIKKEISGVLGVQLSAKTGILFHKPEIVIYSSNAYGKFNSHLYNAKLNKNTKFLDIVKMNIWYVSKLVNRLVRRKIRSLARWANKPLKQKFKRRRPQMKMSQSWGNAGKHHTLRYKKEKFFWQKEFVLVTGLEFYNKKKGILIENRLKFDKRVNFPLPKVKKFKRVKMSVSHLKWLNSKFHILEYSKFANSKFSLLTISSNYSNFIQPKNKFGHVFHLVSPSTLPLSFSIALFVAIINILCSIWFETWFCRLTIAGSHIAIVTFLFSTILSWILEIYSEEQSGAHTIEVQRGFRYAILLFILSELMLFISFFWAYFHFSLNSNSYTGGTYTPNGIVPFYWFRIPLLNTLLLLASGLSLTIAHTLMAENDKFLKVSIWVKVFGNTKLVSWLKPKLGKLQRSLVYGGFRYLCKFKWFLKRLQHSIVRFSLSKKKTSYLKSYENRSYNHLQRFGRVGNDFQINMSRSFLVDFKKTSRGTSWQANFWIIDTVIKGFIFLIYQAYEYTTCMFSINDGVFGAVFFTLTGLHGLHVFLGVMFILISFSTNLKKSYGRFFTSLRTWRRFIHIYLDKGSLPKNCYNSTIWTNRVAFDGAAWYWHFVDVVWLFVFIFIYWWGFSSI